MVFESLKTDSSLLYRLAILYCPPFYFLSWVTAALSQTELNLFLIRAVIRTLFLFFWLPGELLFILQSSIPHVPPVFFPVSAASPRINSLFSAPIPGTHHIELQLSRGLASPRPSSCKPRALLSRDCSTTIWNGGAGHSENPG